MPWVKWIFPNAPNRAVTINMGAQMPAWADIKGLSPEAPEDEEGTMQTRDMVHKLIANEIAQGIPASRIAVGGFSQGGAMAGFICLTHNDPLAGCFVLSGFLACVPCPHPQCLCSQPFHC
jgi:lysophospholipase-2